MLPRATVWPTLTAKMRTWRRLGVQLYPAQLAASTALAGPRDRPRVVQVIGGERAGKSQWTAHEVTALLPWCDLVYLAGDNYANTEREFEYIEDNLRRLNVLAAVRKPQAGQWDMTCATGARIATLSFERGADALIATGQAPDLVVLCEAGLLDEDHFLAAFARVAERRGAVILSGTLKRARPWYVALYRQLQSSDNPYAGRSFALPSWENLSIYPAGRNDPTIKALEAALGDVLFRERIGAEPVPSPLLVFGREFDYAKHVRKVDYDPALPIWIAVDPGYAGAYALLVVQAASASDVRVIDEFYRQYETWDKAVDWLRQRDYIRQDGNRITNVELAVMDVAGRQHHADKSQIEQWRDATGIEFRCEPVSIETGISRLRDFLKSPFNGQPRITIAPRCEGLLWELAEGEQYPRDQAGNPIKERPIDAHNHARKALSYLLVAAFGESDFAAPRQVRPGHNPFADKTSRVGVELVRTEAGRLMFARETQRAARRVPLSFNRRRDE